MLMAIDKQTLITMNVLPHDILAAQAFIDDLQAAAFRYQSETSAGTKGILHTTMQALAMLKTLVNQVSLCL